MIDPPRLSSRMGSPEALLLISAQVAEPPALAEEEVWRRLQKVTAVAAAGATTALVAHQAASASAGAKVVGATFWLSLLKWGAVAAMAAPVAGVALHRVLTYRAPAASSPAPATAAVSPPHVTGLADGVDREAPKPSAPHGDRVAPSSINASALRAEGRLLGSARAKLAAGDADGALEDIAKLTTQFPRGRLIPEREVLAIDALEAHGDRAAARTRAAAFVAQFPNSPYAAHLRRRFQP